MSHKRHKMHKNELEFGVFCVFRGSFMSYAIALRRGGAGWAVFSVFLGIGTT
jgi:hypothetical protein